MKLELIAGLSGVVGIVAGLGAGLFPRTAQAAYARDFTLTNHVTGQALHLSDFAGSVVLLDFFSANCTRCQLAAPDLHTNLHDYYRDLAGNPDGLPVTVLAINEWTNRADTDAFIQTHGLDLVIDDTPDHAVLAQFSGYTLPHFVVINAVTNGVNYPAWQILGISFGYTPGATVPVLRNYLDAVRGTLPPALRNFGFGAGSTFSATLSAQKGRTNWIEATTNLVDWVGLTPVVGSNAVTFSDPDAGRFPRRFYRVRVE